MMFSFGIIIVFSVQFLQAQSEMKCSGHICIPQNYENFNPPFPNKMMNVSVNFKALWIQKVDDIEETISLSLDITIIWEEPRLEVNTSLEENKIYSMDISFLKLLWIPDIFVYDAKKLVKNGVVGDLENLKYQQIFKSHFLRYTVTVKVEIVCYHLHFEDYPFDSHDCHFEMGSFSHPKEELIFTELVIKNHSIYLNQKGFQRSDFLIKLEKLPIEKTELNGYSIAGFKIKLQRNIDKYMFNYYIPSGLMVITSWVR